jgi:hypothetical protein
MTTERDTTQLVRAWLREDDHRSAVNVVDAALAVVERTPQRRVWWRIGPLGRIGATGGRWVLSAAAAVVVVAVVAVLVLPNRAPSVTSPGLSSSPSPSASPSPFVSASPSPPLAPTPSPTEPPKGASIGPSAAPFFPPDGTLPAGRIYPTRAGLSFSIDLATNDWVSAQGFEIRRGPLATANGIDILLWDTSPTNTYADPCAHTPREPPAGQSLDEITAAAAAAPGTRLIEGPTDLTVGGRPAKRITLSIPSSLPCPAGSDGFRLWYAGDPASGRYPFVSGSTIRVWIIDVGGTLVWIDTETYLGAPASVQDDLYALVSSIQFQ